MQNSTDIKGTTGCSRGWTLCELLAVVAILSIVATIAATRLGGVMARARLSAAESDMAALREAIAGERGYLRDMEGIPGFAASEIRIANLFSPTNLYGIGAASEGIYPRGVRVDLRDAGEGIAEPAAFTQWDEERERGWRGPYIRGAALGAFPSREQARSRGFYPELSGANLYLAAHFSAHGEDSIYGIAGECALLDPWGNPYVLQVPPPQAFTNADVRTVSPDARFAYARIVSAGEDGRLDTPCFAPNATNDASVSVWSERTKRLSRQAGMIDGNIAARGDDLVLFISRNDIDD